MERWRRWPCRMRLKRSAARRGGSNGWFTGARVESALHRVAISNSRIVSIDGGKATFKREDYAGGNQTKTMTLDAVEFIRRFLLHWRKSGATGGAGLNNL